jgi:hypothetical protein
MIERGEALAKFPWPTIEAAFLAGVMRALMAALVLAGGVWLAHGIIRRWLGGEQETAGLAVAPQSRREQLTAPPEH